MPSFTILAKDSNGNLLTDANVHIVFRGSIIPLIVQDVGIKDGKTDSKGQFTTSIPLFSDHANITVTKGLYIGTSTVTLAAGEDFFGALALPGVLAYNAVPITAPAITQPGQQPVATFSPTGVAGYDIGNEWKKFSDWVSSHLIEMIILIIAAVAAAWILKTYLGPIIKTGKGLFNKGKSIVGKTASRMVSY